MNHADGFFLIIHVAKVERGYKYIKAKMNLSIKKYQNRFALFNIFQHSKPCCTYIHVLIEAMWKKRKKIFFQHIICITFKNAKTMKYQVIKIEKNYVGTFDYNSLELALTMFNIFVEEAEREGELDITQAIYVTEHGNIKERWEK